MLHRARVWPPRDWADLAHCTGAAKVRGPGLKKCLKGSSEGACPILVGLLSLRRIGTVVAVMATMRSDVQKLQMEMFAWSKAIFEEGLGPSAFKIGSKHYWQTAQLGQHLLCRVLLLGHPFDLRPLDTQQRPCRPA